MPFSVKTLFPELAQRSRLIWECDVLKSSEQIEILAALAGEKAVVRLTATDETVRPYSELAAKLDLHFQVSTVRQAQVRATGGDVYTRTVPWTDPHGQWFSVFIGGCPDKLSDAVRLETDNASDEKVGELLGYPRCCLSAYSSVQGNANWLESVLDEWDTAVMAPAVSNPLARLFSGHSFIPDFFPCSIGCPHSLRLAQRFYAVLLDMGYGSEAAAIQRELKRPIVRVGRRSLIQLAALAREGDAISFNPAELRTYGPVSAALRTEFSGGHLHLAQKNAMMASNGSRVNPRLSLIEFSSEPLRSA